MQHFSKINRRGTAHHRDDWQCHHLIPRQCGRDPALRDFFSKMRAAGFRIDDFSTNGILLPATRSAAAAACLPVHAGPHLEYNSQVQRSVRAIRDRFQSGERNSHRIRIALAQIRFLQSRLRSAIFGTGKRTLIPLDHLDLSTLQPEFASLDRAIDALIVASRARTDDRNRQTALQGEARLR